MQSLERLWRAYVPLGRAIGVFLGAAFLRAEADHRPVLWCALIFLLIECGRLVAVVTDRFNQRFGGSTPQ